jgi:uncharacterized protein (TIGR02246 family)
MKTLRAAVVAVLAGWLSASLHAQSASDEQAIRALMAKTTEAFNTHDAKSWASVCTPDARLVTVRGESMNGAAAIEQGLASIFSTRGRNSRLRTLDVSIRFIRPDVAIAHVTNEMSGVVSASGDVQPPHTELSIRVVVKDAGAWKVTAFHNVIVQR